MKIDLTNINRFLVKVNIYLILLKIVCTNTIKKLLIVENQEHGKNYLKKKKIFLWDWRRGQDENKLKIKNKNLEDKLEFKKKNLEDKLEFKNNNLEPIISIMIAWDVRSFEASFNFWLSDY